MTAPDAEVQGNRQYRHRVASFGFAEDRVLAASRAPAQRAAPTAAAFCGQASRSPTGWVGLRIQEDIDAVGVQVCVSDAASRSSCASWAHKRFAEGSFNPLICERECPFASEVEECVRILQRVRNSPLKIRSVR
jgi:hypothetical protein